MKLLFYQMKGSIILSWNYRIVKNTYLNQILNTSETLFEIKEVYYNETGNIISFGNAPVPYGNSVEDVKQCLDMMQKALNEPVIEYKEKNKYE